MNIDWENLKKKLIADFVLGEDSLHGHKHWETVEDFGLKIAEKNGANTDVVRLFAYLHDARRQTEAHDLTHGKRGAVYAQKLRGTWFDLPDNDFDLLIYACTWHAHGKVSNDPTIGACWDADRLDLGRVGVIPKMYLFSTEHAVDILKNT